MQHHLLRFLAFLFLLPALQAHAEDHYDLRSSCAVLPFQVVHKLMLVKAEVDGKQGWFLLDTGVDDLLLNTNFFSEEYMLEDDRTFTDMTGNVQHFFWTTVKEFRFGNIGRRKFMVRAANMSSIERVLDRPIMGLIGHEVFRRVAFAIHYNHRAVVIFDPEKEQACPSPPGDADFSLPFSYQHHIPVIQVDLGSLNQLKLGLDSGASINMLDRKVMRKLGDHLHKPHLLKFSGASTTRRIPYANVEKLQVGEDLQLSYWRFGFQNFGHLHREQLNIDGLLGADFFRLGVIHINFQEQLIEIWVEDSTFLKRYPDLVALSRKDPERHQLLARMFGEQDAIQSIK